MFVCGVFVLVEFTATFTGTITVHARHAKMNLHRIAGSVDLAMSNDSYRFAITNHNII